MNLTGRRCKMVRVVVGTHVEGVGSIGPILDKNLEKKGMKLTMTLAEGGIHFRLGNNEAFIPNSNVVSATLET